MKHCIALEVTCNNQGVRTALMALIPLKTDNGIWQGEYLESREVPTPDGDIKLITRVWFDDIANRDNVFNQIQAVNGMFNQCISPSFVKYYKSYQDEAIFKPIEIEGEISI